MVIIPDRLASVMKQIEAGETINWKSIHQLVVLDLVQAERRLVEEAIQFNEAENERFAISAQRSAVADSTG